MSMTNAIFRVDGFRLISLCLFLCPIMVFAQSDIPLGTWRVHLSYHHLKAVAIGNAEVYGATDGGIMVYNMQDKNVSAINTLSGLSTSGISTIALQASTNHFLVGYEDGSLDLFHNNTVTAFSGLKNLPNVSGSKRINHIGFHNNLAYLSTGYGIVVFDLQQSEIKETWRDLGPGGNQLKIFKTVVVGDSIVAGTASGVIMGHLGDNLLDYNKWKRISSGDLSGAVAHVAVFNNTLYAGIVNFGVYKYENNSFQKVVNLPGENITSLEGSPMHLVMVSDDQVYRFTSSGQLAEVSDPVITAPVQAMEDASGALWIADRNMGLITSITGNFEPYFPNGPSHDSTFRLVYTNGQMTAIPGGFTSAGMPLQRAGVVDVFSDGLWLHTPTTITDITDMVYVNNRRHAASFGKGLEQEDVNFNPVIWDETNSTLQNLNPPGKAVYISALALSDRGLWVLNYGTAQPLHLFKNDNTWQSFNLESSLAKYTTDMALDYAGNVWMAIEPTRGGGLVVFNPQSQTDVYLTVAENSGGLPHQSVNALDADRDGNIWVGTNAGVAYYFSEKEDAIKPIFENRFLLRDEKITTIEVDGGNRKWIGTERGVWLFGPTGETLIANFTSENSPLLSDVIRDIEVNDETGEVFFATDRGIISYRADATASTDAFGTIKIFPNPVTPDFGGTVGISGLATDALVKITDASGKLIWQSQANGGTATWNVRDYNGRHAATGIYFVFAATPDGSESVVGKIAVIE